MSTPDTDLALRLVDVDPSGKTLGDAALLPAAAARVELAAYKLK